jgi:peptidoglycan-N-acetylglucosamine deacetylase
MFSFEIYNKESAQEWNDFINSSRNPSTFQLYEWGEYQQKSDGCEIIRVTIKKDNIVKLVAQLAIKKLPMLRSNIIGVLHGPCILAKNDEMEELLDYFIDGVKKVAKSKNVAFIRLNPNWQNNHFKKLKKTDFSTVQKRFSMLYYTTTMEIDLAKEIQEIRSSFAKRTRSALKKAEKSDLEIRYQNNDELLNDFYDLFYQTTTRKKLGYMPDLKYVKSVWDGLSKQNLAKIFVVYFNGKPLGGAFIVCIGEKCHYLWGGSSDAYREKNANQLLHFEVIKWAKKNGYTNYDLGGIRDDIVKYGPGFGIYLFKSGFNGEKVIYMSAIDYILKPFLYHAVLLNGNTIIFKNKIRKYLTKLDIKKQLVKGLLPFSKVALFYKQNNVITKIAAKLFEIVFTKFAKHKYANLLFDKTKQTVFEEKTPITLSFDCDLESDIDALPKLLGILEKNSVRASFACIGELIERFPEEHKLIIEKGHEIVNHTQTHPNHKIFNPDNKFNKISSLQRTKEIENCHKTCEQILNYSPIGFRAPHFLFKNDVYRILKKLNYKYSSSVFMSRASKLGKPYKKDSIVEFPMTACYKFPLTCMSTARIFRGDIEKYSNEKEYFELIKKAIDVGAERKLYLNFYFDPVDVVKMEKFANIIQYIKSKDNLIIKNYKELAGGANHSIC